MIDLNIVLTRLAPGCSWRLTSSTPPHRIAEWRGPGPMPDEKAFEAEWKKFKAEEKNYLTFEDRLARLEREVFK